MLIPGRCHCGNISFSLNWEPEPAEIPARACTCSFCTKHGGVWTSCSSGSLRATVKDAALVSKYAFGTETAQFHICAKCGVVPVVTCEIDAAEDKDGRLARRERNWIGNVEYVRGGA